VFSFVYFMCTYGRLTLSMIFVDYLQKKFLVVEEVWFWGEITLLDSTLYSFGVLFRFGE
jgi:hypothetical protein